MFAGLLRHEQSGLTRARIGIACVYHQRPNRSLALSQMLATNMHRRGAKSIPCEDARRNRTCVELHHQEIALTWFSNTSARSTDLHTFYRQ
jgi:hypothetical protein